MGLNQTDRANLNEHQLAPWELECAMLRLMRVRRLVLCCFLVANGAVACSSGGTDRNATARAPSVAGTSTPVDSRSTTRSTAVRAPPTELASTLGPGTTCGSDSVHASLPTGKIINLASCSGSLPVLPTPDAALRIGQVITVQSANAPFALRSQSPKIVSVSGGQIHALRSGNALVSMTGGQCRTATPCALLRIKVRG